LTRQTKRQYTSEKRKYEEKRQQTETNRIQAWKTKQSSKEISETLKEAPLRNHRQGKPPNGRGKPKGNIKQEATKHENLKLTTKIQTDPRKA
jgi:hypothetical protein